VDKLNIITAVDNLYFDIKIGVSELERSVARTIRVSFKIYHDSCSACEDDDNKNYICYATISESLRIYCEIHEVKLLEYLCYQLYLLIKSQVGNNKVFIKVEKLRVQYRGMLFDASAEYSDL